jgi:hypothetical protein
LLNRKKMLFLSFKDVCSTNILKNIVWNKKAARASAPKICRYIRKPLTVSQRTSFSLGIKCHHKFVVLSILWMDPKIVSWFVKEIWDLEFVFQKLQ